MLAFVQSSGSGSVFHTFRRGTPCVAHVGKLRYQSVASATAHQDGVSAGENRSTRSHASKGYICITKELLDTSPEWRELVEKSAKYRYNAPVYVVHKEDRSRHTTVLRREFLAACASLPAAEDFLKRQLGINAEQKVRIFYTLAPTPDSLLSPDQFEVNEQDERPLAYLVGYANGWYVSEL